MATLSTAQRTDRPGAAAYAASLRNLKAQLAVLSTQHQNLDQNARQQCDCTADLAAHADFLLQDLGPMESTAGPASARSLPEEVVGAAEGADPAFAASNMPVADYASAVNAARHWQQVAGQLLRELHTLKKLVRIDALTGLHNRRSFDERLPREVASAQRTGLSFCLLMIDVDFFKQINDTHGHPAGDAVLRSVAWCISSCTRPSDLVARFGGDEFAVVLSGIHGAEAVLVAERIRRQIELVGHCPQSVTVSIGVAEYGPAQSSSPAELLAEADRALYLAKHCGRNRVYLAGKTFLHSARPASPTAFEHPPR